MSYHLPDWQTPFQRLSFVWEVMDEFGATPVVAPVSDEGRAAGLAKVRELHGPHLRNFRVGETSERAFRDLVGRCRAEGIPVAFFWMPESPAYRSLYSPACRASVAEYQRRLAAELGVPVFPAPEHLAEEDFSDGYHLVRSGAEKFSRWLADTHVRPWLARELSPP